ncbi:hypothetical protein LSM04_008705 [Trypanosoma melophagium]|uniref:uncharacterized protein n=1 Tax=Trypanosoma melophagium TaxID=715481 RepID=UPI00351A15EE|nr:hypothetical protein LSM04_008705 [Trypanosoma melophagium]
MDILQERIQNQQRELAELTQEQPPNTEEEEEKEKKEEKRTTTLQDALAAQAHVLQGSRAELNTYEAETQHAQERPAIAEELLADEMELLQTQRLEMGDEIHKVNMLKSYAMQQCDTLEKRIAELRKRAAALQEEESAIFHDGKLHTRLYSFSEDGVGVSCGSPQLSTEFTAAAAAQMELSRSTPSRQLNINSHESQTPLQSPQRPLQYSTSRERTP